MRRILLLATVAVMMATMLVVTAGPASATIHSISCGDHAADNPADEENPPGITGTDQHRKPVLAITTEAPDESKADGHARGDESEKADHCAGS